jgi:predicted RNase H-like nuclease (RuvC/YqgF family)
MRKTSIAGLVLAMALGLSAAACEDKQARQENEQLRAQVSTLQKENADLKGQMEQLTASRDNALRENEELRAENEKLKSKKVPAKAASKR